MADLKQYRGKRDPARTPEPSGLDERVARALPPDAPRVFVVQQHGARSLHWDLRLEIDGVLASWAVPKGPSLDPSQRRLAVRTEDHPLDYAHFEGVIPEGNYGAGAMIVWDRGAFRPVDATPPAQALEAGKLDLRLEGHKLRGRFALVRTRQGGGRHWLLLRKGAAPGPGFVDVVEAEPRSVLSGLSLEELRAGARRDEAARAAARAAGARRGRLDPAGLRPMLARRGERPFSRPGWLFELKYDGVRLIAAKEAERVRLFARSGAERTALYPETARALARLPVERCILDGELVAFDARGRSSFERIQRRFGRDARSDPDAIERLAVETPVVLQVFDCLAVGDLDLRPLPLHARKAILAELVPRLGDLRFADHVEGDGEALFDAAAGSGLEGVVAKRADSRYRAGQRSQSWLKLKAPRSAELVVVGLVPGRGSRARLGALMLAGWREGELHYAGNVGSGLSEEAIDALLARAEGLDRDAPACVGAPRPAARGTRWLAPELVCRVRYAEVTGAGVLRQPVFLGPSDTPAAECRAPREEDGEARADEPAGAAAERPAGDAGEAREARLQLIRLDKVFWPVEGYTKGDLLAWYEAVWPWLAPYLEDRPVVLTRYPDGIEGKHFYQKNAPEFTPDWALRETIDGTDYFVCNDLRTLLHVVNSGAIPLHVWSARRTDLERPDWLVLDLDPKQAPFAHVVQVARHLRALLGALGARPLVKTSGQDGLHVLLPLGGALGHREARALGEALARTVAAELPEIATVTRPVAARGDRVYVDFLQNGRGKLIASVFSVRPRAGAPVSMPLRWSQVTTRLDPARWTIRTALRELERRGDPLAGAEGLLGPGVDVAALLDGLGRRLRAAGG